jgi:hypothetical protein
MGTALGNHVGKDGICQPSDDPQPQNAGKQNVTNMVDGHDDHSKHFQLIAGKSLLHNFSSKMRYLYYSHAPPPGQQIIQIPI